ncbi:uroporphyrinogen-III synthase [Gracilibacillus sp. HCP3S3_G5_1]|uniref:uroporphyrinogen-III synthase n=1 Tax=unclassified Gracilibacillus TaxID=2625209 RepID=UPI003F892CB3
MNKPLAGRKVMVTREVTQALPLIRLLEGHGAICESVPLITFEPLYNDKNQNQFMRLASFDWLFFTSVNTVRYFHEYKRTLNVHIKNKIAAVGEKTAQLLKEYGYTVEFTPSNYDGKTMVTEFLHKYGNEQRIALVCGQNARKEIPSLLKEAAVSFEKIVIYRTIKNEHSKSLLNETVSDVDSVFFTSPSTVAAFEQFLEPSLIEHAKNRLVSVAIGNTTADTLRERSFRHILYPDIFTIEKMVEIYIDYIRKGEI